MQLCRWGDDAPAGQYFKNFPKAVTAHEAMEDKLNFIYNENER